MCAPLCTFASAQTAPALAPVPPMGWNSWDSYGTTVTEGEVRGTIDVMARDLKASGWRYVVVDIQWSEPNPKAHGYREGAALTMDAFGRLQPAPNRFPSAASGNGFKALADDAHAHGLRFGIHIMRGIPRQAVAANLPIQGSTAHARDIADTQSTCRWNSDMYGVDMRRPGAQAYYDSIVRLYSGWGVDFIKADDMASPYHADEIAALHAAISRTGRPIVLSLSPGPAPIDRVPSLRASAEMWRIADDLWDNWASVKDMYFRMESWAPLVQPGHWPDADMLPLGHIGLRAERGEPRQSLLTHDEQQTVMTLWSIFRSPLMFGGDLLTLDPYTRSLLTNADVIGVDQHSTGNRVALRQGDLRVWTATGQHGARYLAMINLGDRPLATNVDGSEVAVEAGPHRWTDLWTKQTVRVAGVPRPVLAPHSSVLYRIEAR